MNIFEVTASLAMDTSGFIRSLRNAQNDMNASKKTLSEYRSDVAKLAQQYKQSGMTSSEAWKKAYSEIDKSLYNLGKDADTSGIKFKSFGDIFKTVHEKASSAFFGLKSVTESAGNSVSVFGDVLKANLVSEAITTGFETIVSGFEKIGSAATNFVKNSVSVGESFDSAMSQVYATMGDKASQMVEYNGELMESSEALRKFAKEMGATTKYSATESAEALNYMALAGYDAETSMAMLPNVMNLASAGAFDLARASDMLTDTQTAFGISLERTNQMVDEMAAAASNSNTSVAQLGDAFLTVGGLAKELNGGFVTLSNGTTATVDGVQELEIALGAMANAGIKGSEAGTHMRNLLMKLSAPTEDATKLFEDLGVSVFDDAGNMKSLKDVFGELNRAFKGMNNQQKKLQAISEIFNARDTASATALLAAVEQSWDSLGEAILNAEGAAEKMSQTQMDNLAGAKKIFESAKEGLQISISDALSPIATKFVNFGAESLQALTDTIEKEGTNGLRGTISKIVKNAGTLLYKNIPNLLKNVVKVLTAIKNGIADGLPSFMDSMRAMIAKTASYMEKDLPEFIKAGKKITSEIGKGITKNFPYLIKAVSKIAKTISQSISQNLPVIIPAVTSGILAIIDELTKPEQITGFIDAGIELAIGLAEGIGESASIIIDKVPEIVENLKQGFNDNKDKLKETAGTILSAITGGFGEISFSDTVDSIVSGLANALDSEEWKSVKEKISQGIQNIDFAEITSNISKLIIGVTDSAGKLIDGIDWSVIGGAIGEALNGVDWYGILDSLFGLVETTLKNAPELFKGIAETIDSQTALQIATIGINLLMGKKIVSGIASYLSSTTAFTTVSTALSGLFTKLAPIIGAGIVGWDIGTKIRNEIDDIESFNEAFNETIDGMRDNVARLRASIESIFDKDYEKHYREIISGMYEMGKGFASKKYNDTYMEWSGDYTADKIAERKSLTVSFDDVLNDFDTSLADYIEYYKMSGAYLWGANFTDNFSDGISENSYKVADAINEMTQEIADNTEHHSPAKKGFLANDDKWMPNMIKMFADGIKENIPLVITQIESLTGKLKTSFTNGINELKKLWSHFWTDINEKSKTEIEIFRNTMQAIPDKFKEIVSASWSWGTDMIDNFISGIYQKWNEATGVVSDFTQMIRDFIGFSEPKKGALSNFHTFAPDMIKLFAQGIKENQKLVTNQAENLAKNLSGIFRKPVTADIESEMPDTNPTAEVTVNLTDNVSEKINEITGIKPIIETTFQEMQAPELPDVPGLTSEIRFISDEIPEFQNQDIDITVRFIDNFETLIDKIRNLTDDTVNIDAEYNQSEATEMTYQVKFIDILDSIIEKIKELTDKTMHINTQSEMTQVQRIVSDEYSMQELPDLSLTVDTSIFDKIREILENPLEISVQFAKEFENIKSIFNAKAPEATENISHELQSAKDIYQTENYYQNSIKNDYIRQIDEIRNYYANTSNNYSSSVTNSYQNVRPDTDVEAEKQQIIVENLNISVPGFNMYSQEDILTLVNLAIDEISSQLEVLHVRDNRGMGGAGW